MNNDWCASFQAVVQADCRVLVLGSVPGVASLKAQHYYAHPRNAFWPIMAQLLNSPLPASFAERYHWLKQHGLGLWDVIGACQRPGSLDQAIVASSIQANDISELAAQLPKLKAVACNGQTAVKQLRRHYPALFEGPLKILALPSTSPAHASLSQQVKQALWQQQLQPFLTR